MIPAIKQKRWDLIVITVVFGVATGVYTFKPMLDEMAEAQEKRKLLELAVAEAQAQEVASAEKAGLKI
ncbi:hypothetical protein SARC_09416 [Sphaeroforma arctica JP610]|uniref:Uncharacterized protein n=1 Tax=Sphaeroforma arctica JP610 TaxID=667725 RepID=A0A0L0FN02_9EUKA|nr:hypothetical protein SARC_09416 [Sphaeroforma arctica JP610]KNC78137.1 hypothetical protein SARC_09416 [Sphaeroforma arctica JP610]|eukprot:XP_014152039.1 hypothetical protein SARC_09416 [Sphaeroforma arctica JP610]